MSEYTMMCAKCGTMTEWPDACPKCAATRVAAPTEQRATEARCAESSGSALPRDMVERAERYTDQFCSLTENTTGEVSTRFHAAVLLHELRGTRRYCCALEEQLDEFGLRAAQRAAGFNEPNVRG